MMPRRRLRFPELLLGILLSVAIFAMGMMFRPSYQPTSSSENQSQHPKAPEQNIAPREPATEDGSSRGQPHKQQEANSEFWSAKLTDWLLAVFTALLVAFTYRLWKSTDKLWDAGEKQRLLSEDTAKRQLRAYVTVNGVIRTKDPGDLANEGFAVLVDIKNSGQTPAIDSLQWARIEIKEFPLETQLPIHCLENPTKGILPPEAKNVAFPTFTRALTPIEENAILANHTAIYVYGEVEYLDVFGERHLTQFRFRCNGQGFPLGMFKPDGEGNNAT